MLILVIGGAGFVGRRVVRSLAERGHEVVGLDVAEASFTDLGARVRMARLDLTDFNDVVAAMETHKPGAVINLSYMRENLPRAALKLNVLGMDNCFEAARLCGVEHVVYSSSTAVNGSQQSYGLRRIKETDPPAPAGQYAVHKVFNEWQAREYREKHGMRITGIRIPFVSGTDKSVGTVDHVECIVKPALGEKASFDFRDAMRCVIHADDAAEVFTRIASAPKTDYAIYNSGGETLSLGEIAAMVKNVIPDAEIAFKHETGGADGSGAYLFDNTRLTTEFGIKFLPYQQRVVQMIERVREGRVG